MGTMGVCRGNESGTATTIIVCRGRRTDVRRFVDPQEMETLLQYNGFAIRNTYGDWNRQPLTGTVPRTIYVCQLRS